MVMLQCAPSDDRKSYCMSRLNVFLNDETELFVDDLLKYIASKFTNNMFVLYANMIE